MTRLIRNLGIIALLPLFGLVFWGAATVASSLLTLSVIGVNVHGLGLANYAAELNARPAPLSAQLMQDAWQDATGNRDAIVVTTTPAPATPAPAPTRAPSPTPLPLPVPTPTPGPLPLPTPTPGPLPLPLPTPTPTPLLPLPLPSILPIPSVVPSLSPGLIR